MQLLMNDHDFERVLDVYGDAAHPGYEQHNRLIEDGVAGVVGFIRGIVKWFPGFSYDVKMILVDDSIVTFRSHVTMNEKDRGNDARGFIVYDSWRVDDGQMYDHWDAMHPLSLMMRVAALLVGGSVKNTNGVF
ncbi:MAG: nuclear transport factor 2 family protein [Acidobacteria bacterium]|nr:nuclear transport factor 2 family protein [Acidobacteriota bacterium]